MPITLSQFAQIVNDPKMADTAIVKIKKGKNGEPQVVSGSHDFVGRTVAWLRNATRSEQSRQLARHELAISTQRELLSSLSHEKGNSVAQKVKEDYQLSGYDPQHPDALPPKEANIKPLTKRDIALILRKQETHQGQYIGLNDPFMKLPNELMRDIFDKLPMKQLVSMQRVNARFFVLSKAAVSLWTPTTVYQETGEALAYFGDKAARKISFIAPASLEREAAVNEILDEFRTCVKPLLSHDKTKFVRVLFEKLRHTELRTAVLDLLKECQNLEGLHLKIRRLQKDRSKAILDELAAGLPLICKNNPDLQIHLDLKDSLVDDLMMHVLCRLPNLVTLTMTGTNLDNARVAMLENLGSLKHFNFGDNMITSDMIDTISQFEHLESLKIDKADPAITVERFEPICNMPSLKELTLKSCGIGTPHIEMLTKKINENQDASKLEYLAIPDNEDVNNDTAKYLTQLRGLKTLDVSKCRIKDQGAKDIAGMKNLKTINLEHNRISADVKKELRERGTHIAV